jgi:hypothetical protein
VCRFGFSHFVPFSVILAPYGLAGTLTGQSFKSPDLTSRLLEDWSHFYPLDKSSSLTESSVVEVIVGGVKMKYPSCYVLVTDLDDNANSSVLNGTGVSPPNGLVKNGTSKLGRCRKIDRVSSEKIAKKSIVDVSLLKISRNLRLSVVGLREFFPNLVPLRIRKHFGGSIALLFGVSDDGQARSRLCYFK